MVPSINVFFVSFLKFPLGFDEKHDREFPTMSALTFLLNDLLRSVCQEHASKKVDGIPMIHDRGMANFI